jgi:uncharacterized protein (TIGR02246 family)
VGDQERLQALEDRLRQLEDLLEIQQLFIDYGHYLDQGDFASYAELFAEDAELLLGPVAKVTGRKAIESAMTKTMDGRVGTSIHVISNPMIKLDGDKATSEVMWTVLGRTPEGPPTVTMVGRHRDELVRRDGRWLFQRRRGFIDMPTTIRL